MQNCVFPHFFISSRYFLQLLCISERSKNKFCTCVSKNKLQFISVHKNFLFTFFLLFHTLHTQTQLENFLELTSNQNLLGFRIFLISLYNGLFLKKKKCLSSFKRYVIGGTHHLCIFFLEKENIFAR